MASRIITLLTLFIPIACFGDTPESIIGKWQFDSVRTVSEFMDQVFAANPGIATLEQIEEQKAGLSKQSVQTDGQVTARITSDTIRIVNETSGTNSITYKIIGGNSGLFILDATSTEIGNTVINIRLVEGGIAMETLDCQSQPEPCERMRELQRKRAENKSLVVGPGMSATPPARRPGPAQPQWIYFRPLPTSAREK